MTRPALFESIQHPKKRAFLAAYALCGHVGQAARDAHCDYSSHYIWRKQDPEYLAAFEEAREMAADVHEDEATRRALGWDETHYTAKGQPYTVRKYSDTMLIVRLKALRPEKYRENLRQDDRQDISELLKAVLLELVDRQPLQAPAREVEWAPLPPVAPHHASGRALPAPPGVEEEH